jgi:hypothetical protein
MGVGSVVRLLEHLNMLRQFGSLEDLLTAMSGTGNGDPQLGEAES